MTWRPDIPIKRSNSMRHWMFFVIQCGVASASMACQPLSDEYWKDTPSRVKSNFDAARFVVVAQVTDVRQVMMQAEPGLSFKMEVEQATFRVERAFKGKLKRGDTFVVRSGLSSCARGVRDPGWIPFVPGEKTPRPTAYPTRWFIYYTPPAVIPGAGPQLPPFEITSSPRSRPVEQAQYDIDVLTRHAGDWTRKR